MNLTEARKIYVHPWGHNKEELKVCLVVINKFSQPIELNNLQFAAIADAIQRLKMLELVCGVV